MSITVEGLKKVVHEYQKKRIDLGTRIGFEKMIQFTEDLCYESGYEELGKQIEKLWWELEDMDTNELVAAEVFHEKRYKEGR